MTKFTSAQLNASLPYAFGDELNYVSSITKELGKGSHCVMIGAGPCVFGLAMFEGNPKITLDVIEINSVDTAKAHLEAGGYLSKVKFLIGDSAIIGMSYTKNINFLLIDGDHSYQGVEDDMIAWLRRVPVGGLVMFHDYVDLEKDGTNGVRNAIEENLDRRYWEEVDQVGCSYIIRRK